MDRARTPLALALFILGLAACGGGGQPAKAVTCQPAGTTIAVAATAGSFDVDCIAVPAGQAFTVTFTNKDTFFHNFTIRQGSQSVFAVAARPGGTSGDTQNGMKAGRYEFVCTIHPAMKGTFIVAQM